MRVSTPPLVMLVSGGVVHLLKFQIKFCVSLNVAVEFPDRVLEWIGIPQVGGNPQWVVRQGGCYEGGVVQNGGLKWGCCPSKTRQIFIGDSGASSMPFGFEIHKVPWRRNVFNEIIFSHLLTPPRWHTHPPRDKDTGPQLQHLFCRGLSDPLCTPWAVDGSHSNPPEQAAHLGWSPPPFGGVEWGWFSLAIKIRWVGAIGGSNCP